MGGSQKAGCSENRRREQGSVRVSHRLTLAGWFSWWEPTWEPTPALNLKYQLLDFTIPSSHLLLPKLNFSQLGFISSTSESSRDVFWFFNGWISFITESWGSNGWKSSTMESKLAGFKLNELAFSIKLFYLLLHCMFLPMTSNNNVLWWHTHNI